MKANIKLILAASFLALSTAAFAQRQNSGYFTKGNTMRHELNPAFGGEYNYFSIPILGNLNENLRGNFGMGDVLFQNKAGKTTTFLSPDVSWSEVKGGLKSKNELQEDYNMQLFGAGFRAWGGYNTIGLNVRTFVGAQIPFELFEVLKTLGNQDYQIGETDITAQAWVELALGHSRRIDENWRVGGKLKFLFGAGRMNVALKNVNLKLADKQTWTVTADAEIEANVKGMKWETETKEYNDHNRNNGVDPKGTYETIKEPKVDGAGLGGFGMGVDLGAEYDFKDLVPGLKASVALLDLSYINWNTSLKAKNKGDEFTFKGFQNIKVMDGEGVKMDQQTDDIADRLTDLYRLQDAGDGGSASYGVGATLNIGAEYTLPYYDKLRFGFLSSTRMQGKYSWNEERISANVSPLRWLEGNVNLGLGTFGADFGWQLNIHPRGFNFFIGMDHMLGKVSKQFVPLDSRAQLSLGMNVTW